MLIKRLLMGAERLDHLLQEAVGLLDLFLLGADFFFGLADIEAVTIDECSGFGTAFMVRADAVLS